MNYVAACLQLEPCSESESKLDSDCGSKLTHAVDAKEAASWADINNEET